MLRPFWLRPAGPYSAKATCTIGRLGTSRPPWAKYFGRCPAGRQLGQYIEVTVTGVTISTPRGHIVQAKLTSGVHLHGPTSSANPLQRF